MGNIQILNILKSILKLKKPIIAISPNSDAGYGKIFQQLELFAKKYSNLKVYQNFPRQDYLGFLKNAYVLIGNSSSGIIEGSYLGTPVVNIGPRQNGREQSSNVINVKKESKILIKNAIRNALKTKRKKSLLYGNGNSSQKIIRYLEKIKLNYELIEKQLTY